MAVFFCNVLCFDWLLFHRERCTFPKQLSKTVTVNFSSVKQDNTYCWYFFQFVSIWRLRNLDTASLMIWHQIISEFPEVPHGSIVNPCNICLNGINCKINTWEKILKHPKISWGGKDPENPIGGIFYFPGSMSENLYQTGGISYNLD